MSKKLAREAAMSLLYELEVGGGSDETLVRMGDVLNFEKVEKHKKYIDEAVETFKMYKGGIDSLISEHTRSWKLERLSRVDLSILRLAVVEMVFMKTPVAVIINESIELARTYSLDKSPSFVNGVLGGVAEELSKGANKLRDKITSFETTKENTEDEIDKGFCGLA